MLKTGVRGERKGILTPSLSKGEGECRDGKDELANVMEVTQEEDNDKLKAMVLA